MSPFATEGPTTVRATRLDRNGQPGGPTIEFVAAAPPTVTTNGVLMPPVNPTSRYGYVMRPYTATFRMHLGKRQARRLLELLGLVRRRPWKAAHARRYRRRR